MMRFVIGSLVWQLCLLGQTQIDLISQSKPSSRSLKSGTVLPSTCLLGDMFVKLNAPSGQSLYACTTENLWIYQGGLVSIFSNGVEIGARPVQNFATGIGITQAFIDAGSRLNLLTSVDTAVIQTRVNAQTSSDLRCTSNSGSATAYTCVMSPVLPSLQVGMVFHWIPDIAITGAPATLSINGIDAKPIKLQDGVTNPAATEISAGRLYQIWYDGISFRILWRNVPTNTIQTEVNTQVGREVLCSSSSASSSTYTCALSPSLTSYTTGMLLRWRPDIAGAAGALTLNIDGLGVKAIKLADGSSNPASGDILASQIYQVWYDGTNFRLLNLSGTLVSSGSRPTCNASQRGRLWFVVGSTGVKDDLSACAADSTGTYQWRLLY